MREKERLHHVINHNSTCSTSDFLYYYNTWGFVCIRVDLIFFSFNLFMIVIFFSIKCDRRVITWTKGANISMKTFEKCSLATRLEWELKSQCSRHWIFIDNQHQPRLSTLLLLMNAINNEKSYVFYNETFEWGKKSYQNNFNSIHYIAYNSFSKIF
jgi:hypothetical protein